MNMMNKKTGNETKRQRVWIWYPGILLSMIVVFLASVIYANAGEQSGMIHSKLDQDDAYLSEFQITKIIDGTENFDTSEDPESPYYKDRTGNDENGSNGKVRTFDEITYNLSYKTEVSGENYYENGALRFELLLPLTEKEAVWNTDAMSWMDYGWSVTLESRTCDFNSDGIKETQMCQVLRGKKTLVKTATNPTAIPGKGTLMAVVKVRAMKNGSYVRPVMTAWMDHNRSGETELDGENVYPTELEEACGIHARKEHRTVIAEKTEVTAQPRYNVQIKQGLDSYNQVIGGTYDFDEGNEKALDKGIGKVTGTTTAYGITLQLYNDKGKDLKGIELPKGPITFELELASEFIPAERKLTQEEKKYVTDNYAPVVLSWGPHKNIKKTADDRNMGENAVYVIRGGPGNSTDVWEQNGNKSCYNGGEWNASKCGNTITVTVQNYEIDTDKFPNTDMGVSAASNTYYDYQKKVENIGCFSAGMFFILTPAYNNGATDPERKGMQILEDLNVSNGTFRTTIKDRGLQAESVSGQRLPEVKDASNQTGPKVDEVNQIYGDDSITSTVYLSRKGSRTYRNQYSMADGCGGEKEKDPLGRTYASKTGNWGNGKDALVRGYDCAVMNGLMNLENGDANNRIYAANILTKFNAEAITLTGKTSVGSGVREGKMEVTVLYAAKEDGTDWKNDEEMLQTKIEELRYFRSLKELEQSAACCVGYMTEYRPQDGDYTKIKKVQQGARLYSQAEGKVSMSAEAGRVYQTVVAVQGWCGRDYVQTISEGGVPSMEGNNPTSAINLPKTTYTVYRPYEKTRYNEYGYAGGHTGSYDYGDSLYILDTMTSIRKYVEQQENETEKSIYHVSDGQRYVDYVLNPKFEETGENQTAGTNVTVTDILPEKLSYVPGSAQIGGRYIQNTEPGQAGKVIGGAQTEPEMKKNTDGTVSLIWRFLNVGSDTELPRIHYSAQIGTPGDHEHDVQNNEDLLNIARIKSDGDIREYDETSGNESKTGIRISKLERSSPSKIPDQRFHDVTDSVGYTINVGNNSGNDMVNQLIMDTMPMNNDSRGNVFSGTMILEELQIDPSKLGNMESWKCYYTENDGVKDTTAKDYNYEDILTNQRSERNGKVIDWKEAKMQEDGTITAINGKSPTAIVWIGNLKGEKTLSVHCKIKIEGAEGGNVIVNGVSYGDDETAKPKVYFADRKISGLAWLDTNEDGQRQPEETLLGGVRVNLLRKNDKGIYEAVTDENGKLVETMTGEKDGRYEFHNLPAGEYGIRFSSGTEILDKYNETKVNTGDDATDSDGMEILHLVLPAAKDMLTTYYESRYNDVGFCYKKGKITIKKTDGKGNGLKGAVFQLQQKQDDSSWKTIEKETVTDEKGITQIEELPYGEYRLTEKKTKRGYHLLKEPIHITIPYVTETKGDTEPSYVENHKYYYLELSYQIMNDHVFTLPSSGGSGYRKWYLAGLLLIVAGLGSSLKSRRKSV